MSGTLSWMVVLAIAAMLMPPTPIPNMHTIARGIDRVKPRAASSTPRSTAPATMIRGSGRPRKAIVSAASSDPTPDAAIRKP